MEARLGAGTEGADHLLLAAEEAVAEAARVARVGYREGSTRENAMFNLLTSFAATFILVRVGHVRAPRDRSRSVRSATSGWVAATSTTSCPGIVIAFGAGAGAIVTPRRAARAGGSRCRSAWGWA